MFSHVMVGNNDIDGGSKKFYDAVFAAVGGKSGDTDARGRLRYVHNGGVLMVSRLIDKPACPACQRQYDRFPSMASAWNRPMPGTRQAWRMAGRRSKIRRDLAERCISLTFAIPMATNSCALHRPKLRPEPPHLRGAVR